MEREKGRTGTGREQENLNGRIIAYRFSDEEEGNFKTAQIKRGSNDEVSRYVFRELERIESDIKTKVDKMVSVSSEKKHGESRPKREVTQIRESLTGEINKLQEKEKVLKGEADTPIVFVREGDEITGSNLSLSQKEAHWWSFVRENPEILKFDAEERKILTRAYFLRYDIRARVPSAKEDYFDLLGELRERDTNEKIFEYMAQITKKFAN